HLAPERLERAPRPFAAALHVALDEGGGVHRPGAGAAHPLDGDALVLEEAVEHAPGEGAVRAAALQREVDGLALAHQRIALSGLRERVRVRVAPWQAVTFAELRGPPS